jgi:hypothetical protein
MNFPSTPAQVTPPIVEPTPTPTKLDYQKNDGIPTYVPGQGAGPDTIRQQGLESAPIPTAGRNKYTGDSWGDAMNMHTDVKKNPVLITTKKKIAGGSGGRRGGGGGGGSTQRWEDFLANMNWNIRTSI